MRAVELFAGAGGLGMGLSRAGFRPVAVIERDRYCCDTIRENKKRGLKPLTSWPLVEGDIRDFDFRGIRGEIDLVSGGPPCQPFSLGGKHQGRLDDRDMFPDAIRAVRQLRPRAFLFENVKGLTRQGNRVNWGVTNRAGSESLLILLIGKEDLGNGATAWNGGGGVRSGC